MLELDGRRRPARGARDRRAASSSTARASATSATSCCATAAISPRTASCSPSSRSHQQSGEIVAGPDLVSRGVVAEEASPEVLEGARSEVLEALEAINPESRTDPAEVKEEVRKALRRYFKRFDRRPVILPFVLEM